MDLSSLSAGAASASVSEPSSSNSSCAYQPNPALVALSHQHILESVLRYLSPTKLKEVSEVNLVWEETAKVLLRPTFIEVWDDIGYDELYHEKYLPIFQRLKKITILPDNTYMSTCLAIIEVDKELEEKRAEKTAELKKVLEVFQKPEIFLNASAYPNELKLYISDAAVDEEYQYYRWKRLTHEWEADEEDEDYDPYDDSFEHPSCGPLLELIKRATNLRVLDISNAELNRSFFITLLGPEGLVQYPRFKETLEELTLGNPDFDKKNLDDFRQLNLKLKKLCINNPAGRCDEDFPFPSISPWLEELSPTLESLTLEKGGKDNEERNIYEVEFLTKMNKLKFLHINEPELFGMEDMLPLLEQLPNLETLRLICTETTLVKQGDYMDEAFNKLSYPHLKELIIETQKFNQLDCQPFYYVPKLFPNLRKLSMTVFSQNTFLNCVHNLKEMMIEELTLKIPEFRMDVTVTTSFPWGSKLPSLNDWKILRKLTLAYFLPSLYNDENEDDRIFEDSSIKVYNLPMENILPKSLTSLELINLELVDFGVLQQVLQSLPLLMDLTLDDDTLVDEDGEEMDLPVLREKLANDPLINPYLHVQFVPCSRLPLLPIVLSLLEGAKLSTTGRMKLNELFS